MKTEPKYNGLSQEATKCKLLVTANGVSVGAASMPPQPAQDKMKATRVIPMWSNRGCICHVTEECDHDCDCDCDCDYD